MLANTQRPLDTIFCIFDKFDIKSASDKIRPNERLISTQALSTCITSALLQELGHFVLRVIQLL